MLIPHLPHLLVELLLLAVVLTVWMLRERRLAAQGRALRTLCALGEGLIATVSPREILRRLSAILPGVLGVTGARLYLYNRRTKQLDRVVEGPEAESLAVDPGAPPAPGTAGVTLAFRNRALLAIPDARHSPLLPGSPAAQPPRAVLFVPMFAQNEVVGILEIEHAGRPRRFTAEEQAVAQHLANQMAAALRLSEQRSIQEQLFRSEKLAAAGQVISGVAQELRGPLEAIHKHAERLLARGASDADRGEVVEILTQSRKAIDIVTRLAQFANVEAAEVRQIDLGELLGSLLDLRERTWATLGLEARDMRSGEPVPILGSPGQLEQVLSTLFAFAEKSAVRSLSKTLSVSTKLLARRALVEISFPWASTGAESDDPFGGAGERGLAVCRGIVRNHGGELRFRRAPLGQARFEVDLPATQPQAEEGPEAEAHPAQGGRPLTALLVEPEKPAQRQLLVLLSQRGHRVVPVENAEEALDLAERLHFDLVCCSVRLSGLNWVEFFHRVRHQTGAFVLLTEGFDAELARAFQAGEGYLISKPVQTGEFDRVLSAIEAKNA